jgi:hypothetical protein
VNRPNFSAPTLPRERMEIIPKIKIKGVAFMMIGIL